MKLCHLCQAVGGRLYTDSDWAKKLSVSAFVISAGKTERSRLQMHFLMWSQRVNEGLLLDLAGRSALNVVCLTGSLSTVQSVHVLTRDKEVDIRCDDQTPCETSCAFHLHEHLCLLTNQVSIPEACWIGLVTIKTVSDHLTVIQGVINLTFYRIDQSTFLCNWLEKVLS